MNPGFFCCQGFRTGRTRSTYLQFVPPVKTTPLILVGAVLTASISPIFAAGGVTPLGTGAPPTRLGPYSLTPFPFGYDDPRTGWVADVPSPLGGSVVFSSAMEVLPIGDPPNAWRTWSHGFTGDVYAVDLAIFNANGLYEVRLDLPAQTGAFLFYAEPGFEGLFTISARLDDGTTLRQEVEGFEGAAGFGFTAPLGASLSSIFVLSEIPNVDFAIGEFNIARTLALVPEAGTTCAGLLALGLAAFSVARRFPSRR